MRGFVRQVTSRNGLVKFDLTTSRGEFEAWTPATQSFDSWQGSILRLQGVCAAIANPRHQLIGIQIWVPEVKYLQVEEAPPDDLFAVPMRPLDSLRRFNSQNALNQRVRTEGTVVLQIPGQCLYVQDGEDGIIALSQSKELVYPGDRVEVVGFPGNEGRRFLLREALYRRISTGKEPSPIQVSDARSVNLDFEGLLGKGEGVLLNIMNKESETRLLIRSRESVFEASLISNTAETEKKLAHVQLGSRLAVTGVYQAQSDEYGNARSFLLQLRSWDDLRVLAKPPWWTLARLLWLLVAVLAVSLFVLFWGIVLSRKNALLRDAQSELQLAHDKLEIRVQERTRELQERTDELQEQVTAKEKAREQLAEAQRSLLLASRQAGMAEVATGVLHNVGNVLNSVNISATIVNSKITQSCSVNLNKVLVLLRDHQNDIAGFFAEDPKGRKLIEYLEALNQHMAAEKTQVLQELSTLTQNVEHIKEIVSMQQSYAQVSGVLEILDPTELLEDGIRMHSAAYVRHAVKVIREYSKVPRINVDRHKALQVLTNLLHNAKYACEDKGAGDRIVRVRLGLSAPDRIRIEVEDNGVGIAPENLTRIFAFGFTTRRNGHGFGLHSGALAAREMGGSLQASSQGVGHGATFTLELPVKTQSAQPGLIADSPPNPSHQLASPCAH
jgi:signal transduction histidine kinase